MTCPVGAITVSDNLSHIDYDKCIDCHKCADVCPMGCIAVCENASEDK